MQNYEINSTFARKTLGKQKELTIILEKLTFYVITNYKVRITKIQFN